MAQFNQSGKRPYQGESLGNPPSWRGSRVSRIKLQSSGSYAQIENGYAGTQLIENIRCWYFLSANFLRFFDPVKSAAAEATKRCGRPLVSLRRRRAGRHPRTAISGLCRQSGEDFCRIRIAPGHNSRRAIRDQRRPLRAGENVELLVAHAAKDEFGNLLRQHTLDDILRVALLPLGQQRKPRCAGSSRALTHRLNDAGANPSG